MSYYKVLEQSFIGHSIQEAGTVVEINDDPAKGGMEPGSNLAACDADGNLAALAAAKPVKASKKQAPAPTVEGDELA